MAGIEVKTKTEIKQMITGLDDADTLDKIAHYYDKQAQAYDTYMVAFEYNSPKVAANCVHKFILAKNARILDVACGTGLVCEHLREFGYTDIDGLDGSAKSIDVAREKNIYKNLYVEWLGGDNKTSIADECYDAIVCVGAFAINHLKSDCFGEFLRIVKPGSYVIITMREVWINTVPCYSDGKLEGDMKELETAGKWKLVEKIVHKEDDSAQDSLTFVLQKS